MKLVFLFAKQYFWLSFKTALESLNVARQRVRSSVRPLLYVCKLVCHGSLYNKHDHTRAACQFSQCNFPWFLEMYEYQERCLVNSFCIYVWIDYNCIILISMYGILFRLFEWFTGDTATFTRPNFIFINWNCNSFVDGIMFVFNLNLWSNASFNVAYLVLPVNRRRVYYTFWICHFLEMNLMP